VRRFISDRDAPFEQHRLDVAQAQVESETPPTHATDDDGRKTVVVIKLFRLLHIFTTSFYRRLSANLTVPPALRPLSPWIVGDADRAVRQDGSQLPLGDNHRSQSPTLDWTRQFGDPQR
jgi:hypothetical protein